MSIYTASKHNGNQWDGVKSTRDAESEEPKIRMGDSLCNSCSPALGFRIRPPWLRLQLSEL